MIPPLRTQRIRQQVSHRIMQSRLLHVAKPLDDTPQIAWNDVPMFHARPRPDG